jgi:hypothetical protein
MMIRGFHLPSHLILGREMFVRPFYSYLSCTWSYNLQFSTSYVVLAPLLTKVQVATPYPRNASITPLTSFLVCFISPYLLI